MELEILNKLYLELSQIATAKTQKELSLEARIERFEDSINEFDNFVHKWAKGEGSLSEWRKLRIELLDKLYPIPF